MALARAGQRDAAESERRLASAALDRALARAVDPSMVAELLAMRYRFDAGIGDRAEAERTRARLRAVAPDSPLTAMIDADASVSSKDLEGGRRALESALRLAPLAPELLWLSGLLALELGDVPAAEARFDTLAAEATSDPDWILSGRMGRALARHTLADSRAEALEEWRAAIDSDATRTTFRMVIDEMGTRAPDLEKRLRAIGDEATTVFEDDPGVAFAKAYVDRASGFPERALDEIDRILGRGADPYEVDLLWLAVQAHSDLDQPEAALVRARALLDHRPWHLEALIGFVEAVLRRPDSGPDRDRALAYVKDARAHFDAARRSIVEGASRETPELRARLAENDRYFALLDQMEDALERP